MTTDTIDVRAWLAKQGLSQYVEAFESNDIDGELLPHLDEASLTQLGVASVGHRIRLLRAIEALNAPPVPGQATSPTPGSEANTGTAEGERRQVTVLFCDIVDYTRLAGRIDPEELQGLVNYYEDRCTGCVTRFGGTVFQRLGDGIVAFFGYPQAHEGDAERATLAALAILEALTDRDPTGVGRIHVRIGIATGVVVFDPGNDAAVGETMNLAARLQGAAPTDSVVVCDRVRRLTRGAFDYEDLAPLMLKGIEEPVRAFRVKSVNPVATRFDAAALGTLTPLAGRDAELALLVARWNSVRDGEGQVVVLSGEPGIGKSRLLRTLGERLRADGASVLRFQASPYYSNSPYYPICEYLRRTLRLDHEESDDDKQRKLERVFADGFGMPAADVRVVADLLSISDMDTALPADVGAQKRKHATFRVLIDLIETTARDCPTTLFFEDAHWADPTTLEVLDVLVDCARTRPLLLVITHRSAFARDWSAAPNRTSLSLSRLTRADCRAMISAVQGSNDLPEPLIERILDRTDGVPLYVEEFTRSVVETYAEQESRDGASMTGLLDTAIIPSTLRDSLMSRLDRAAEAKEVAKIGAAIGREFSAELLCEVSPLSAEEIDAALAQLTRLGFVQRRGRGSEASYVFTHALVQDVAYDSSLKSQRKELHSRIAGVLERRFPQSARSHPELIARHLSIAGDNDKAIDYWTEAGRRAVERFALGEATSHLDQGLLLVSSLPAGTERDRTELRLRALLGTAVVAFKGFAASEAWDNFRICLDLVKKTGEHGMLPAIYFGLISNQIQRGRMQDGVRLLEEMLDAGKRFDDADLVLIGHRSACTNFFWLGEFEKLSEHAEKVLARYDIEHHRHLATTTNTDPRTIAIAYRGLATWISGYPDSARRLTQEMHGHARLRAHPFDLGYALTFGSQVWELRGELDCVLENVAESEQLAEAESLPIISDVLAKLIGGIARVRAGELDDGIATLQAALGKWEAGGSLMWTPYLRSVLAEGLCAAGDAAGALALVEESLQRTAQPGCGERSHLPEVLRVKGRALEMLDDRDAAALAYADSIDAACRMGARSWELRATINLADLWRRQGRGHDARERLAAIYGWFSEGFDTRDLRTARSLLDELS